MYKYRYMSKQYVSKKYLHLNWIIIIQIEVVGQKKSTDKYPATFWS